MNYYSMQSYRAKYKAKWNAKWDISTMKRETYFLDCEELDYSYGLI